jgi:hypothetical protein
MVELCWLQRHGIGMGIDSAELSPGERLGLCIIFSRFEGMDFDFKTRKWYRPKA